MSNNSNLNRAKKAKNDEFYTQLCDIEAEMKHYTKHFVDKCIYCNCDDPTWSNFWRYFHERFSELRLRKLISTHFERDGSPSYALVYEGGDDGNIEVGIKVGLKGDGDFRSEESIGFLKEADIVVTNPPFSLFREYMKQLMEYGKKFIVIGNLNAVTYKEIFPLIKNDEIWLGVQHGDMAFTVPDDSESRETRFWIDDAGQKWRSLGNGCWYTNLDYELRHVLLPIVKYQIDKYSKFDYYDAINVDKVCKIPQFDGAMGVPITFLFKCCPEQFEILSANDIRIDDTIKRKQHGLIKDKESSVNHVNKYVRLVIRLRSATYVSN